MKKTIYFLLLAVSILVTGVLSSCGNNSVDIGVCLTNTSTTLNAAIGNAITEKFPDKKIIAIVPDDGSRYLSVF